MTRDPNKKPNSVKNGELKIVNTRPIVRFKQLCANW